MTIIVWLLIFFALLRIRSALLEIKEEMRSQRPPYKN